MHCIICTVYVALVCSSNAVLGLARVGLGIIVVYLLQHGI